jgi:fructokinase
MPGVVLSFGEILWDLLPDKRLLGGAPFNFAYRLQTLGEDAAFVSRLGEDELGEEARGRAVALGMNAAFIQSDPVHPTGRVPVTFDKDMEPSYVIVPDVAYDYVEMTDALREQAGVARCICFGTLIQRSPVSRGTLHALLECAPSALKVYDINLRKDCFSEETITYSLERADLLKINDEEAEQLIATFGMSAGTLPAFCAEAAARWNIGTCVVTLGERGVLGWSKEEGPVYVPGRKVDLADSLGSGDSLAAGLVHRLLAGDGLPEAATFGNVLGALVATKPGGTPTLNEKEIEAARANMGDQTVDQTLSRFIRE